MTRGLVGRGDLLRALVADARAGDVARSEASFCRLAGLLGFDPKLERVAEEARLPEHQVSVPHKQSTPDSPRPTIERKALQVAHYVEVDRTVVMRRRQPEQKDPLAPTSWVPLPAPANGHRAPLRMDDLTPPARLMPRLRETLGARKPTAVNIGASVARAVRGLPWHRLVHETRAAWPQSLLILMDLSDRLRPYWLDMHGLAARLLKEMGQQACQVRVLHSEDPSEGGADWRLLQGDTEQRERSPVRSLAVSPAPGQSVLLLTDMGMGWGIEDDRVAQRWSRWLRLQDSGAAWQVLSPIRLGCPSIENTPSHAVQLLHWSARGIHEPRRSVVRRGEMLNPSRSSALADLLALCSPAVRIEPALLRRLRRLLGAAGQDAGLEAQVWWYRDMKRDGLCCHWGSVEAQTVFAERFRCFPERVRKAALHELLESHAGLSPFVRNEEALRWHSASRGSVDDGMHGAVKDAVAHFQSFLADLESLPAAQVAGTREYARRLLARSTALAPLAEQIGMERLANWVASQDGPDFQGLPVHVVQSGCCIRLRRGPIAVAEHVLLTLAGPDFLRWSRAERPGEQVVVFGNRMVVDLFSLEQGDWPTLHFRMNDVHAILAALYRPTWAEEWKRDRAGRVSATVAAPNGRLVELTAPFTGEVTVLVSCRSDRAQFGLGADPVGCFVSLKIDATTQYFRYIEPGTFLMGSPDTEPNRDSDEGPCHQVMLTEGYWLADTTCTQALWQAVMGNNPSQFKGDPDLPVENVSWDDVQEFLTRLNSLLPSGCEAALPTEAQWEFACRAGTQTPYWFGQGIAENQVNFGGKVGKTVQVKGRPANGWGLYQMHGNVWEWCSGSRRQYSAQAVENPPDGQDKDSRALRGGSWRSEAWGARSACRDGDHRDFRFQYLGFRFSLRSIKPSQGQVKGSGGSAAKGVSRPAEPGKGASGRGASGKKK